MSAFLRRRPADVRKKGADRAQVLVRRPQYARLIHTGLAGRCTHKIAKGAGSLTGVCLGANPPFWIRSVD
jgi:hypothetical protein